eukprot:scaffold6012_cov106-Isochrysis_galbana.AAC.6
MLTCGEDQPQQQRLSAPLLSAHELRATGLERPGSPCAVPTASPRAQLSACLLPPAVRRLERIGETSRARAARPSWSAAAAQIYELNLEPI